MHKKIIFLLIIFFIFLAKPAYSEPLPFGSKIMLVGDSLSVGLSHRFKILSKEYKYIPITDCIEGTNISQWSTRLPQKIKNYKPNLILASLGTNDSGNWGKSFVEHPIKLDKLIKDTHDLGVDILWIGIPEMPKKRLPYSLEISDIIKNKADYYFDSIQFKFKRAEDGIHFTAQGYNDWMDSIWDWMIIQNIIDNPNEED